MTYLDDLTLPGSRSKWGNVETIKGTRWVLSYAVWCLHPHLPQTAPPVTHHPPFAWVPKARIKPPWNGIHDEEHGGSAFSPPACRGLTFPTDLSFDQCGFKILILCCQAWQEVTGWNGTYHYEAVWGTGPACQGIENMPALDLTPRFCECDIQKSIVSSLTVPVLEKSNKLSVQFSQPHSLFRFFHPTSSNAPVKQCLFVWCRWPQAIHAKFHPYCTHTPCPMVILSIVEIRLLIPCGNSKNQPCKPTRTLVHYHACHIGWREQYRSTRNWVSCQGMENVPWRMSCQALGRIEGMDQVDALLVFMSALFNNHYFFTDLCT